MAKAITISLRGGERLQKYMRDTARRLGHGSALNVGFLSSATYPNGLSVAQNAFWQEFGTKFMPPRPFLRRTIDANSDRWGQAFARIAKDQKYDAERTLTLMGEGIKGQIVESIQQFTDPPLAPSTVAKKGFDKPLIDQAIMIRSVDYEVVTT